MKVRLNDRLCTLFKTTWSSLSRCCEIQGSAALDALEIGSNDSSSGRFASLDAVRVFACVWVLAYHSLGFWFSWYWDGHKWIWQNSFQAFPGKEVLFSDFATSLPLRFAAAGSLGVDVFFVLSGFFVAHILIRERLRHDRNRYCAFMMSRYLRLLPVLLVALLMMSMIEQGHACRDELGWYMTFSNQANFACLGQAWSLSVEFQLYAVTPFLLRLLYPRVGEGVGVGRFMCGGMLLIAISVMSRAYCLYFRSVLYLGVPFVEAKLAFQVPLRCAPYICGVLLACSWDIVRVKGMNHRVRRLSGLLAFVGTAVFISSIASGIPDAAGDVFDWSRNYPQLHLLAATAGRPLFGCAFACMLWAVLNNPEWRFVRLLSHASWRLLANATYAAYMLQDVVQIALAHYAVRNTPLSLYGVATWWGVFAAFCIYCFFYTSGAILVGIIVHACIEHPCLKLRSSIFAS